MAAARSPGAPPAYASAAGAPSSPTFPAAPPARCGGVGAGRGSAVRQPSARRSGSSSRRGGPASLADGGS
eukprot:7561596-Alexandrium_andersonii.AAC.1